jgi:hypothetical protein
MARLAAGSSVAGFAVLVGLVPFVGERAPYPPSDWPIWTNPLLRQLLCPGVHFPTGVLFPGPSR